MRRFIFPILAIASLIFATYGYTLKVGAQKAPGEDNQNENEAVAKHSKFQYAAKFVCGLEEKVATENREGPVKPGNYATVINIHNPWFRDVSMVKKAVIAVREPEQGRPSQFIHMVLNPDGATSADCTEIRHLLNLPGNSFIDGFFVIYSLQELDVSPVYTAQSLDDEGNPTGMSIDVEHVDPRKL